MRLLDTAQFDLARRQQDFEIARQKADVALRAVEHGVLRPEFATPVVAALLNFGNEAEGQK